MKTILTIAFLLICATTSHATVLGWLTSQARDWEFVKRTGGIRISKPIIKDGKKVLPVEYDPSGLSTITQKPVTMNSGLVVREIKLKRKGSQIVIRVVTHLAGEGGHAWPPHYADLDGIPTGRYQVYYESAGDAEKSLGEIVIE